MATHRTDAVEAGAAPATEPGADALVATSALDVRGLTCPLPVLKARKALAKLAPGDILDVLATDPQSPADFAVLCETQGHRLLHSSAAEGVFRFLIARG